MTAPTALPKSRFGPLHQIAFLARAGTFAGLTVLLPMIRSLEAGEAFVDRTSRSLDARVSSGFTFEQKPDRVIISHVDRPVAHYVFKDERILRPYFAQVHTPDGIQVTRNHPPLAGEDPIDHDTMHPGIWLAFGDVGGQDFWRNRAAMRHERFTDSPIVRDANLRFATESSLLATNGVLLARLISQFTLAARADGFLLIWRATVTPASAGFYFGDQEEMGFGVRVATPIAEKKGGVVQNAVGVKGAKATWGRTSAWCDYSGVLSNRLVGVTVMPDPVNFRASWFHSRDYGLVVANPFGKRAFTQEGEASRVPVKPGEVFQLRFAAFIHSTSTNQPPDIAGAYHAFTNQP